MRTVNLPNEVLLSEISSLLNEGHTVTLKAKGNSMQPFIVGGRDNIVLVKTEKIEKGDIVLAKTTSGNFVLHRIIDIKNKYVTLMGDGNIKGTEQCRITDIAAQAITIIRKNRQISTSSKAERLKVRLWIGVRPIRKYLLAIYRRIIV